jgi:hypothetical protein
VAKEGRASARAELSDRFLKAIDVAAMRAGLIGTDAYLGEWRRELRPCGADLEREVRAEASRLEEEFSRDVLDSVARRGGLRTGEEIE